LFRPKSLQIKTQFEIVRVAQAANQATLERKLNLRRTAQS